MSEYANDSRSQAKPQAAHAEGELVRAQVQRGGTLDSPPARNLSLPLMQLQRTVGNQALQRMLSSSARHPAVMQRVQVAPPQLSTPNSRAKAALDAAAARSAPAAMPAPPKPAAAKAETPKDLSNFHNYHSVYQWLQKEAKQAERESLFGFFDALSPKAKMHAIRLICGGEADLGKAKSAMLKGLFSKSVDWDKFSEISRTAKEKDVKNYNKDQAHDYASYAAIASSGTASAVAGNASLSNSLGASRALGVAEGAAPAAGILSGISAVSQINNAAENYDSSLSTMGKAQVVAGEAGSGAADLTRFSAGSVNSVRALGGMAASGTATLAAGVAGVAGGAFYLGGGLAEYHERGKNKKALGSIKKDILAAGVQDDRTKSLVDAAELGASTQDINRSKSAATAAKGALMIAGGAVMIAAAASPIGPALLAAAAIVGGIGALIKFYRKSKRKAAWVDATLKVDEEMKKPENKEKNREQVRQELLGAHGYNSVDQCYAQIVTDLASMLYESGVEGEDEKSAAIIEGLGLKINKPARKPDKRLIAKKLHS